MHNYTKIFKHITNMDAIEQLRLLFADKYYVLQNT